MKRLILLFSILMSLSALNAQVKSPADIKVLQENAEKANEALYRSHDFVQGWLTKCDPVSGLIPRNLVDSPYWNAQDAAADNYPFMVLTTFFTDKDLFEGKMFDMLNSEIKLTSKMGPCPASYSFKTHSFLEKDLNVGNIIFGSAEYMKDGLLPLTEWLGESPWSDRMISILDGLKEITKGEPVTKIEGEYFGGHQEIEVSGDLLQVLSRVYWMTGNKDYLDWAEKIADHYLLDEKHFITNEDNLRLRDHGGEIVLGLCEFYATLHYVNPEKKAQYKNALYAVLDRILRYGRNEHGMFYDEFSPKTGKVIAKSLADTWGYILDGFYTVYLVDHHQPYHDAVVILLCNLKDHYQHYNWEVNSSDGIADAVESALNLYNREPMNSVAQWIDTEIASMFAKQQSTGIIEGWHGDGNFARTAIMYALWKTKGCFVSNWNRNLFFGAEMRKGGKLSVWLDSKVDDWKGELYFDRARHKENLHLPLDWTRINQFPEWFTVDPKETYQVTINGKKKKYSGKKLSKGLSLSVKVGSPKLIEVIKL